MDLALNNHQWLIKPNQTEPYAMHTSLKIIINSKKF